MTTLWTGNQFKIILVMPSVPADLWAFMFSFVLVVQSAKAMKRISILLLLVLSTATALAQSDLCWRDPYPWIPGEWAGSGFVVEAGNRFEAVPGAVVELWSTTYNYDDARQHAIRHKALPATLVETTQSDAQGAFIFIRLRRNNDVQPGSYEIRVRMPARESSLAYTQIGGPGQQWMGRSQCAPRIGGSEHDRRERLAWLTVIL
jgi:hypothetical protein